jgi:hypothetical protein
MMYAFDPATGKLSAKNPLEQVPQPGCTEPNGQNTAFGILTLSPTVR